MADRAVTILPAAAASHCFGFCTSYYTGVQPPSYQGGATIEYTNYQLVLSASGSWTASKIVITYKRTYNDGTTSTSSVTHTNQGWANPYIWPAAQNYNAAEQPFEFEETDPGTEWRARTVKSEIVEILAYFTSSSPVPTDLLVNSSSVESPAKLVYDPTTNRLVVDY